MKALLTTAACLMALATTAGANEWADTLGDHLGLETSQGTGSGAPAPTTEERAKAKLLATLNERLGLEGGEGQGATPQPTTRETAVAIFLEHFEDSFGK